MKSNLSELYQMFHLLAIVVGLYRSFIATKTSSFGLCFNWFLFINFLSKYIVTSWVFVGSSFNFLPPAIVKASSLKNSFILCPVFADTSRYVRPSSPILEDAIDDSTQRYPSRSHLFPTIIISASSPRTSLTLSIHLLRLVKELESILVVKYWWYRRRWQLR